MADAAWARRVYEHDKRTAEICRDMQIAGFRFDVEKAQHIAHLLREAESAAHQRITQAVGYELNPLSPNQLQAAFFGTLRAPVYFRSSLTGRPSLGVDAMRGYAASARPELSDCALAVLDYRRARKLRRTYVEGIHVGLDGRVHPTWLNYGTISGRFACQGPNLMNLPQARRDPTAAIGGIRSLYVASPGHKLIYWDYSQLEMRVAAYASGDAQMIATCEGKDIHAGNAAIAFGDAFDMQAYLDGKACGKVPPALDAFRQIAKQAGFAICYGANADTVHARILAEGQQVPLRLVEAMLRSIKGAFRGYYKWQAAQLNDTIRTGYVATPLLGRRRHVGHDPDATAVMNFPIQGGAGDIENAHITQIVDQLHQEGLGAAVPLVAQVHDANVLECPDRYVDDVTEMVKLVTSQSVVFPNGREGRFPIELKVLERWQ